jgi:hypothetical protein
MVDRKLDKYAHKFIEMLSYLLRTYSSLKDARTALLDLAFGRPDSQN